MIKELEFKGRTFKIEYVETYATHPTWYSFEDEKDVREAFWDPKEGEVVLDVGACCGFYTLPALAHGAKVHAWAPGRLMEGTEEYFILTDNIRLNNWIDNVYSVGLYDQSGVLNVSTQVLYPLPTGTYVCGKDEIAVTTLDTEMQYDLDGCDWIKIDVEGAELNVLKGARETIKKHRPKILVECHLFVRQTMAIEVTDFLIDEIGGYTVTKVPIPHRASNVVHVLFEPA